jgi:putative ABC transport system substrate-binding protein
MRIVTGASGAEKAPRGARPITRRRLVQTLLGLLAVEQLLGCQLLARSSQAPRQPRVGVLWPGNETDLLAMALADGFQQLGYVDGQNIRFEWRFARGQRELYEPLAEELAHLPLDAIVANPATVNTMRQVTTSIPIVFGPLGDPVTTGIVQSLARPGANVTGLSMISPQLAGKRLELLNELVPRMRSVAAIWNPRGESSMAVEAEQARLVAEARGIRFESLEASDDGEIRAAFDAARNRDVDGLLIVYSPLFRASLQRIVEMAAATGRPAISGDREFAVAGGLMAYGPNLPELWRNVATYVDKIVKGANPTDLPVEQADHFDLVINQKTAQALGFTIPSSILVQATEILQ